MAVTDCPRLHVTADVPDAVEAAGFARKGAWPCAGGTLDQTASFLRACAYAWDYEDAVRREMKLEAITDG